MNCFLDHQVNRIGLYIHIYLLYLIGPVAGCLFHQRELMAPNICNRIRKMATLSALSAQPLAD